LDLLNAFSAKYLERSYSSIASRIPAAAQYARWFSNDATGVTHSLIKISEHFNIMTHGSQLRNHFAIKAGLQF
jgi:hypothetical protein